MRKVFTSKVSYFNSLAFKEAMLHGVDALPTELTELLFRWYFITSLEKTRNVPGTTDQKVGSNGLLLLTKAAAFAEQMLSGVLEVDPVACMQLKVLGQVLGEDVMPVFGNHVLDDLGAMLEGVEDSAISTSKGEGSVVNCFPSEVLHDPSGGTDGPSDQVPSFGSC